MNLEASEKALILLVDDQPTNLHILTTVLRAEYDLCYATEGEAALRLAKSQPQPQLILLDIMMPGISGIEVLRRLRANEETEDIPVIMVSADTSDQTQLDGLDLGADDFLAKPVVFSVLLARVRNLLQRKRTEMQMRLAAHVFKHSGEAFMITDSNNCIIEINPAFTRLTGYELEEVRGKNPRILASGRVDAATYQMMWKCIKEQGLWQGELWDRHKNGNVYPKLTTISTVKNRHGKTEFHIASFADISAQKAHEAHIQHLAHHDALTGLPNRLGLRFGLEQSLALARRETGELALMFIDLDRFKLINDTLGHDVGDGLLIEVAQRLRDCLRETDLVGRLGGDEFVIIVGGRGAAHACHHVAEKILERLGQLYEINGHPLRSSPSIGISLYPHDGSDEETLMKCADTAMYHAKSCGRNNYQFFSSEMNRLTADRMQLEQHLHLALEGDQFLLHYQPQVDATTQRIIGVEALVRWQHPQRGIILPGDFISIAEESGLILRLGDWVLETACRQLRHWRDAGHRHLGMAVNLSQHQLRQSGLAERIAAILSAYQLTGADLELEITESAAMQDPDTTIKVLRQLRALDISIAIDDFGTGHSSLTALKLLPVQRLKLDRSFVKDIETDPNDAAICSATIALAKALELQVVAEGVETPFQRDYLHQLDCSVMQGYLFAKPLSAKLLSTHLRNTSP